MFWESLSAKIVVCVCRLWLWEPAKSIDQYWSQQYWSEYWSISDSGYGNLPTVLVTHCPSWFGWIVVTNTKAGSCSSTINSDQEITMSVKWLVMSHTNTDTNTYEYTDTNTDRKTDKNTDTNTGTNTDTNIDTNTDTDKIQEIQEIQVQTLITFASEY